MNVNLAIIADSLGEQARLVHCRAPYELLIEHVELMCDERCEAFDANTAYIVPEACFRDEMFDFVSACFITIGYPTLVSGAEPQSDILAVPSGTDIAKLLDDVRAIVHRYTQLSNRLLLCALRNDDASRSDFFDCAYELVGNPFLVFNPSDICNVYRGVPPKSFTNETWLALMDGLDAEDPVAGAAFTFSMKAETARKPFVFLSKSDYELCLTNIYIGKERYGRIVYANTERPFTPGFFALTMYFAEIMRLLTESSLESGRIGTKRANFLIEILNGHHVDEAWLLYNMKALNLADRQKLRLLLSAPLATLAVESGSQSGSELLYICERMEKAFPGCSTFVHQNRVVTLLSNPYSSMSDDKITEKLNHVFSGEGVRHALSMKFYELRRLRLHHRQCLEALHFADMGLLNPTGNCVIYDPDAFFFDFTSSYHIVSDSRWLIHPKIALLYEYDKQKGTNNVKSLQAFLEHGCNIKRTAEVMYIHYNTLVYRLERMSEIAEIDIKTFGEDSNSLFHMLLSCKLLTSESIPLD